MCRHLQVADSRVTTAVTLILAQALLSGSTSLMCQLMGDRVLHRRAFAQRGPSALRLYLGAQLLLERLGLADAEASALPALRFGALRSHRTRVTGTGWNVDVPAHSHRKRLAVRTGDAHVCKINRALLFGEQCAAWRPRPSNDGHARRRPLGNPRARHVPEVNIELQQPLPTLQFHGQQLHGLMLRLMRRAD